MLLWSKAEQLRFSNAVEKLVSAVQALVQVGLDLQAVAGREKQRKGKASAAAHKANATRKAAASRPVEAWQPPGESDPGG